MGAPPCACDLARHRHRPARAPGAGAVSQDRQAVRARGAVPARPGGRHAEPGLRPIIPLIDVLHRVSLRIVTMPIQSQGIITRDNVSVDVSAVAYFRVVDAMKSVVAIENVPPPSTRSPRPPCARSSASTPWTRRCRRPTASTWASARSSTCRPRSGAWRSPWWSSRTSSCRTA